MDKNKSRTDLLAAGRKKLQQFRQKKDGKGSSSHGKSSKKLGKSEQNEKTDPDIMPTSSALLTVVHTDEVESGSQHPESEVGAEHRTLPHGSENAAASPDVSIETHGPSSIPLSIVSNIKESEFAQVSESPEAVSMTTVNEEFGVDSSSLNEGESTGREMLEVLDSNAKMAQTNTFFSISDILPANIGDASEGTTVSVGREMLIGENQKEPPESKTLNGEDQKIPLLAHEHDMDAPLIHQEVVQASDDADGLGLKHHDRGENLELEGNHVSSLPELGKNFAKLTPGDVKEAAPAMGEVVEAHIMHAEHSANHESDELTFPSSPAFDPDRVLHITPECLNQQEEQVTDNGNSNMSLASDELGILDDAQDNDDMKAAKFSEGCQQHYALVGSVEDKDMNHKGHRDGTTSLSQAVFPLSADTSSISLSELTEVIKKLSEDEYNLMLQARESVSSANLGLSFSSPVEERSCSGVVEHLEEELVSLNFTKDIFHLQLEECSKLQNEFFNQRFQLTDEISMLQSSLAAVQEKNDSLTEELWQCRSEHDAVIRGRDDFCSQLNAARDDLQELGARAFELQNSLEMSQENLRNQSRDLADCRSSMAALQIENERLNGIISFGVEERKNLGDEKENFLRENQRLLIELDESQRLVRGLQAEIATLNGDHASMLEGSKKLEEEKEHLAREIEGLSTEVIGLKGLVEALEVEKANLHESLTLLTEEVNKTRKENDHFALESERLSSEVLVLREQLSIKQNDHMRAEEDLKGKTFRIEQLTEENLSLSDSLDLYLAKMKELDDKRTQIESSAEEAGSEVKSMEAQGLKGVVDATGLSEALINRAGEVSSPLVEKPLSHSQITGSQAGLVMEELSNECSEFLGLSRLLKKMEKIVLKLERAVDSMHSESTSSSKAGGKVAAAGVSKLIQAFELKTHLDEHEEEERGEDQPETDPYSSSQEQIGNLKAICKQLSFDVDSAASLFKGELDGRGAANGMIRELKIQCETLREHSHTLEASAIELGVLYEVLKQSMSSLESDHSQLEACCEALKQQNTVLRAENTELSDKLGECQNRKDNLGSQLRELQQYSNETMSALQSRFESFRTQATERTVMLQLEWNVLVDEIVETVCKLDEPTSNILVRNFDGLDMSSHVTASVSAAIEVIENLQGKLGDISKDREAIIGLYKDSNEKLCDLQGKSELAVALLNSLYSNLRKTVHSSLRSVEHSETQIETEGLHNPLDPSNYDSLMEQVANILSERLQLVSEIDLLRSQLDSRMQEIQELNARCVNMDLIHKFIEDVKTVVNGEEVEGFDGPPLSCLGSLISILVQKYRDANEHLVFSREVIGSKEMELSELQEIQSNSLNLQHENEILILKESLSQAEEAINVARRQLHDKIVELEQSEQRVSSLREKLGIAVAKGKGLVVQRDNLKQSLADTSSELEKCSQELQLKEARLLEVEIKLGTYSEAGERVEALESELAYIRNSANALRESFLLKDSLLQKIEEILEDLDLPEHFHAKDIVQKVEWLARSVSGSSLPLADWDQKSSVGGSHSDAGFVIMDPWREDMQPGSNSIDDLRRKYDELQGKFYGLAEQNEMLEQSLTERNYLVQRWEELLDKINLPSQGRSVEPEEKIEWLCNSFSEAENDRVSLLKKIDDLESYCSSLAADLEESQRIISELEADLKEVSDGREQFSERLKLVSENHEKLSETALQLEHENEKLKTEAFDLHQTLAELAGNEESIRTTEREIRRLQEVVGDALNDHLTEDMYNGRSSIAVLEDLLEKLVEKFTALRSTESILADATDMHDEKADATANGQRAMDTLGGEEPGITVLKKQLDEALSELMQVKQERDSYLEKSESLFHEVAALGKRGDELQELLKQEEQKTASLRDKLNVAVRKGKSLVQQRDNLKQNMEEINSEMDHLKSEISRREFILAEYEHKIRDLTSYSGRVEALESEILFLRKSLEENELSWQDKGSTLSSILSTLSDMDVGSEVIASDPVERLRQIEQLCYKLRGAVASSEQESKKSKRAAELLLAELNEVQERNDSLQEEIAQVASELTEISHIKNAAEAARLQAISRYESLSSVHNEERRKLSSEFTKMKSSLELLWKVFSEFNGLLADVLSEDYEILHNLGTAIESSLGKIDAIAAIGPFKSSSLRVITNHAEKDKFFFNSSGSDSETLHQFVDKDLPEIWSFFENQLQKFSSGIVSLKDDLHKHSSAFKEQAGSLSKVLTVVDREIIGQKESSELAERDVERLKSTHREKDIEISLLRRGMALLCEACSSSLAEIENCQAALLGKNLATVESRTNMDSLCGGFSADDTRFSSEEFLKNFAGGLLTSVKNFASVKAEIIDNSQKELKSMVANLQKELQEKDIQKDRICMELVNQIKEAEVAALGYSSDLQSSKSMAHKLEIRIAEMEAQHTLLQKRLKEMQDGQVATTELQERLQSLTNLLASKDQEIEALMQALDEEETQMEHLGKKIEGLEKVLQQKNLVVEELEASRGKALKKLSITVNKFDELHHFSVSLLAEIEKLQAKIKEQDCEVSFLRQEVTRCTNDVLVSSRLSNNGTAEDFFEFLTCIETLVPGLPLHDVSDKKSIQVSEYKELLQKKIEAIVSELEDLRAAARSKDALLLVERSKVEDLTRKGETLERSLREKESQLNLLQGVEDSRQPTGMTSEIVELEPVMNKWAVTATSSTPQVRSLRKANNDQVAISIDEDPTTSSRLEDEDDDKVHGFKSLTTSRIVPKFTRPLTDMVDGLWVSCDRALMRRPALRLSIILYWAVLHALLASFVV
ncbi:trans-Golgi network-localized SYP41-interacting protein 1 isoform X1 [Rhodamnia argentea]|uniref:Trans-Golgi network-localized SYP41-interacting protein 1 isoform X1 n=1 Tax=Rhodamnia argentea TaxID=178133 RepID=A0A8B8Q441_9MYRT|nr:trans-Golgi network-localized SYP41-interacting protein 1 isoform X1 [Rhodamnia argentea]